MVIDLYGYKMWCESTTENSNFILKTIDPDGERLCSIHKQRRRVPNFLAHMVTLLQSPTIWVSNSWCLRWVLKGDNVGLRLLTP